MWCFNRFNDEVAAAEADMPPGGGISRDARQPVIKHLLASLRKMPLRAENVLCEAVQGRPCPSDEARLVLPASLRLAAPLHTNSLPQLNFRNGILSRGCFAWAKSG